MACLVHPWRGGSRLMPNAAATALLARRPRRGPAGPSEEPLDEEPARGPLFLFCTRGRPGWRPVSYTVERLARDLAAPRPEAAADGKGDAAASCAPLGPGRRRGRGGAPGPLDAGHERRGAGGPRPRRGVRHREAQPRPAGVEQVAEALRGELAALLRAPATLAELGRFVRVVRGLAADDATVLAALRALARPTRRAPALLELELGPQPGAAGARWEAGWRGEAAAVLAACGLEALAPASLRSVFLLPPPPRPDAPAHSALPSPPRPLPPRPLLLLLLAGRRSPARRLERPRRPGRDRGRGRGRGRGGAGATGREKGVHRRAAELAAEAESITRSVLAHLRARWSTLQAPPPLPAPAPPPPDTHPEHAPEELAPAPSSAPNPVPAGAGGTAGSSRKRARAETVSEGPEESPAGPSQRPRAKPRPSLSATKKPRPSLGF
eukprot:tig00001130_g7247.t1